MEKDSIDWYLKLFGFLTLALTAYMTYPFIEGITYGLVIYYITKPIKRRINAVIHKNTLSAVLSITILLSLTAIPVLLSSVYIANTVYKGLPQLIDTIKEVLPEEYGNQLDEFTGNMEIIDFNYLLEFIKTRDLQTALITPLTNVTEGFFWFLLTSFIALVVSFYLLIDSEKISRWIKDAAPEKDREVIVSYMEHMDRSLNRIFVGVIFTMIITSVFALIALTSLNAIAPPELKISAALILGLTILCGIFNLLPGVGIKIVWVPMAALFGLQMYFTGTLLTSLWFLIIFAAVMAGIVDFIPDQLLRPYICGGGIHTGLILLSFIFGSVVFGAKGLFLGPIILAAFVEYMRVAVPKINSQP